MFVITPFGIFSAGEIAAMSHPRPKNQCYKCKREGAEMNHRFWSPIFGGIIDDLDDWKFMDGQSSYSPLCDECKDSFCPCVDCKCFMKPAHVQICNECSVNLCTECAPANFFSQCTFSNDSDPICDQCQNPKSEESNETPESDESGKPARDSDRTNKEPEAEQKRSKRKRSAENKPKN